VFPNEGVLPNHPLTCPRVALVNYILGAMHAGPIQVRAPPFLAKPRWVDEAQVLYDQAKSKSDILWSQVKAAATTPSVHFILLCAYSQGALEACLTHRSNLTEPSPFFRIRMFPWMFPFLACVLPEKKLWSLASRSWHAENSSFSKSVTQYLLSITGGQFGFLVVAVEWIRSELHNEDLPNDEAELANRIAIKLSSSKLMNLLMERGRGLPNYQEMSSEQIYICDQILLNGAAPDSIVPPATSKTMLSAAILINKGSCINFASQLALTSYLVTRAQVRVQPAPFTFASCYQFVKQCIALMNLLVFRHLLRFPRSECFRCFFPLRASVAS